MRRRAPPSSSSRRRAAAAAAGSASSLPARRLLLRTTRATMLLTSSGPLSILARRRGLVALASGAAPRHWSAGGGSSSALSTTAAATTATTTTTTTTTAAPVDLPATVSRILRSLEHERGLGCGDARGARASFSEFMAGPAGLARLETPWLPPAERAALARLRGAYAGYGGLPLPAREALLADTSRLADRHAHFLCEGAWPASAAGAGGGGGGGRERSPSPQPLRRQQEQQQQQQQQQQPHGAPPPRPGSVLRRRTGLTRRLPSASLPVAHPQQQQRPATASASPLSSLSLSASASAAAAALPFPPLPEASSAIPQDESASFAAALDQLLPPFQEEDEGLEEGFGLEEQQEEVEQEQAAEAAALSPPPPDDGEPLPPLPFRAPPSHPALRRLQRRSTAGAAPQEQQHRQQAAAAPFAFEPLLHDQPPQGPPAWPAPEQAPPPPPQQQQQPAPAASAAPSPSASSPEPAAGIDLGAAWRLYWPVPPLEHWRELDAAAAAAAASFPSAGARGGGGGGDGGRDGGDVRTRPMMPTESLGPRDEAPPPHPSQLEASAAGGASSPSSSPSSSSSPLLSALFEEMCAEGGAPGLGTFVEDAPLLPLAAALPPPDDLWGPAVATASPSEAAEGSPLPLGDDDGAPASSAADALLTAAAAAQTPPPERHLVWRPALEGLLLPGSSCSSGGGDGLYYGAAGHQNHHLHYEEDDHAAWRAFVESAVAWRRRDDADARALRALSRSPDEDQQRTPDWHAARGSRLTASAFCNAVGWFGRYPAARLLDAQRLWREKVGLEPPPPANAAMRRGTALEPLAQRAYAELVARARGGVVEPCSFKTWSEGPAHDWLSASPDGLVQVPWAVGGSSSSGLEGGAVVGAGRGGEAAAAAAAAPALLYPQSSSPSKPLPPALALAQGPGILEIKCPSKALQDPAQHLRKLDYYCMQVQGQLEFSGREWAHLYLWTPGQAGSALALVRRDRAYWRVLWQVLADFWWGHVAPARLLRREGAAGRDVMAYLPRREHPWAAELRARSRQMLRDAPVLAFGAEVGAAAAAEAAMAAAEAEAEAAGSEMEGSV